MNLWFYILIPLLVISFFTGCWINAERRNESLATRIAFGAAMVFSVAASVIVLWQTDVAGKTFYDHHNFEQVVAVTDLALQQGKAQQVQTLFAAFHTNGSSRYTYQGVSQLRESLFALLDSKAITPQPTNE